jgi:hypothetical protein
LSRLPRVLWSAFRLTGCMAALVYGAGSLVKLPLCCDPHSG